MKKEPGAGPRDLDLDTVYESVDLVYQAVERPDRLGIALRSIARLAGAQHALVVSHTAEGDRRVVGEGHVDPDRPIRSLDPTPGGFFTAFGPTRTVPLGFGFDLVLDREEFEPGQLSALLRVTPHLARALRFAGRLSGNGASETASAALERVVIGVVLLDRAGNVVALNRPARTIVTSSNLIRLRGDRIEPTQAVPRTLFEALIERAVTPAHERRRVAGGRIELRAPGRAPVDLVLAPYRARLERGEVCCVLIVSSPGSIPGPEEVFVSHYRLSENEARVAAHLVAGRDPVTGMPELHADLVRAHQERVFEELGSTRQDDLVRLLLRPAGVLFDSSVSGS